MRVLHILSERGFSGGEHQLLHVLRHLEACGHHSTLVLNPGAAFRPSVDALGVEVRELRMRNDADVAAVIGLRRLVKRLQPDLLHFACSRSHKLGAHATVRLEARPPRVVTRRMDYPLGRSRYRRWLYARAVEAVVCVSESVRSEVLATGVSADRVHVIHDGVDVDALGAWRGDERRRAARAELDVGTADLVGVTAASLHRRKGHDVLLDALGRVELPAGASRLVWIVAGQGPERAALEQRASGLPPRVEVRFVGQVASVESLLAAADVFCLPSRKEGLGVALLEAMAVGLAVVGSSVGGMKEAIEPLESGVAVPPGDPAALAGALTRVFCDPVWAKELGEHARQRVCADFSVKTMCERTEAVYAGLVARMRR